MSEPLSPMELQHIYDSMDGFAAAAWDFAVATFLLAALTVAILHALNDLFLRAFLQRRWLRKWIAGRGGNSQMFELPSKSTFDLPLERFCAQVGAGLNATLERIMEEEKEEKESDLGPDSPIERLVGVLGDSARDDLKALVGFYSTKEPPDRLEMARRRIIQQIERSLDSLLTHLIRKWRATRYAISIAVAGLLGGTLVATSNAFLIEMGWASVTLTVVISAGITAPGLQDVVTWLRAPR